MFGKTTVGGLELAHPLMNAAGTCKLLAETRRFAASAVSAVVNGSHTVEERRKPRNAFYMEAQGAFSLNAMKLYSPGKRYLERNLRKMVARCHERGKPFILNIAAFSPGEFAELAKLGLEADVDGIEVNLSSPTCGAPICYQREPTALVVNAVNGVAYGKVAVWYKLGPDPDPLRLESQVKLIVSKGADALVATNTFGGAMVFNPKTHRPYIEWGPAGIGGSALLAIGVGMVSRIRDIVPDHVGVVGVGGIKSSAEIDQYLLAGANAVQAGTACWKESLDPRVYGDILHDRVVVEWNSRGRRRSSTAEL